MGMAGNGRFCSSYEVSPSSFRYYSSSVEFLADANNKSSPDSGYPNDDPNMPEKGFYENLPFHGIHSANKNALMAGLATGVQGMGIHPSNIAGGVAAVNSTMAMAATTRLGGMNSHNRHRNYQTTQHPNQQVLSSLGNGMVAYGVTGSNLSSTSSSS